MTSRMRIGVAICCYKGHIPHLKRLFDSIQAQTRLPDEVVVSCSSSRPEDIPYRQEDYTFPFTIMTCEEPKNAAQNRNRAAAACVDTVDVISFFDADDTMHPQRIDIIYQCFTRHAVVILLHSIEIDPNASFIEYGHPAFLLNSLARCPWGSTVITVPMYQSHIANGHASIRSEVFPRISYRESADMQGREDTLFSTDVIFVYPMRTAYCNYKLSQYFPSRTIGAL